MPASMLIFAPSFAGTALGIGVAVIVGMRRSGPAWRWMVLLGIAVAWWCAGQTFWILADTPDAALRVNQVQYVGVQFAPLLWLLVALAQTGRRRWLRPSRVAPLLVVPLITLALAFSYRLDQPNWLWSGFHVDAGSLVPRATYGPWFKVFVIHNYALFLAGCVLLGSHYVQSPHYRLQFWVTSVIPALLLGMNVSFVTGYWPSPLDPTPLGFAVGFALLGWALLRHRLLDLRPLGRSIAFDSLGQGVLIVDAQQRIVDLNDAASRLRTLSATNASGAWGVGGGGGGGGFRAGWGGGPRRAWCSRCTTSRASARPSRPCWICSAGSRTPTASLSAWRIPTCSRGWPTAACCWRAWRWNSRARAATAPRSRCC